MKNFYNLYIMHLLKNYMNLHLNKIQYFNKYGMNLPYFE